MGHILPHFWDVTKILINNIRFRLAFKGIIVFIGIIACVLFFDIIGNRFVDVLASKNIDVTLRHFSWHFQAVVSKNAINTFLKSVTLNKNSILSEQWFYIVIIVLYVLLTFIAYFLLYFERRSLKAPEIRKNGLAYFFDLTPERSILFIIVSWVAIKQILYVFVIPPWQTPDEIFHYIYIGSYTTNVEELKKSVLESGELFNFKRYSELTDMPFTEEWLGVFQYRSNQPSLYYYIAFKITQLFGITGLQNSIYISRLLSSVSIIITILIVYLISLRVFAPKQKVILAILSTIFAAAIPQASYIGASMGSDAMMIMFITGSILCMIVSLEPNTSMKKTVIFYVLATILAILAMSTKSLGFCIAPVTLSVGILICYSRFLQNKKTASICFGSFLLLAVLIILLYKKYDFSGLYTYFDEHMISRLNSFYSEFERTWGINDFENILIYFVSFWLSYGWMVYKMSIGSYLFLGIITCLVILGVFMNHKKAVIEIKNKPYIILWSFALFLVFLVFMLEKDPQGRYFYSALSSFAVIFTVGLYRIIPNKYRSNVVRIIAGNLLLSNALIVFGLLIPVFYLV